MELMGLEPTTPCLQSRCSSQLSYSPEEPDDTRILRRTEAVELGPAGGHQPVLLSRGDRGQLRRGRRTTLAARSDQRR